MIENRNQPENPAREEHSSGQPHELVSSSAPADPSLGRGDGDAAGLDHSQGVNREGAQASIERRIWRNSIFVLATAVLAAALFAGLKLTLGLIVGGALALL